MKIEGIPEHTPEPVAATPYGATGVAAQRQRVRGLLAAVGEPVPTPLPEQSTRVAEAMAAQADDRARREWRSRVEAARTKLVVEVGYLLDLLEQQERIQAEGEAKAATPCQPIRDDV